MLSCFDLMNEVTRILNALEEGDPHAADQLLPLVYDELRRLAAAQMANEAGGHTLQPTALVHEVYLRLVEPNPEKHFTNRQHFFRVAATALRRILIDRARRKHAHKRGGTLQRQDLADIAAPEPNEELLALDAALDKLAACDPIKSQLVELRYFAGLTGDQAAEVLGISPSTADRYWTYARAWLQTEMEGN